MFITIDVVEHDQTKINFSVSTLLLVFVLHGDDCRLTASVLNIMQGIKLCGPIPILESLV